MNAGCMLKIAISSGAACARIYWAGGLMDTLKVAVYSLKSNRVVLLTSSITA